jgi:GNAT superfamily N-acetyltransferase
MSLEYALEKYPITVELRRGLVCAIRPLEKKDESRWHKFLLAAPEEETLYLKQPITDRKIVHDWCVSLDYEENLPLLMLHDTKVVGMATLHQRRGGWRRHIGLITIMTHPEYCGLNVGRILSQEVVEIAPHAGLRKLEARLTGERKVTFEALEAIGFRQLLYLADYVLDMHCQPHDYVLMGMDLHNAHVEPELTNVVENSDGALQCH